MKLAPTIIAAFAIVTTQAFADEFSRWTWRVPSPPSVIFRHVVFAQNQFVAVGFDGYIMSSTNGTNWFLEETVTTNTLHRVVYGGEQYVASGNHGTVTASPDGHQWRLGDFPNDQLLLAVAYGNDTYVALDAAGNFARSPDALHWTLEDPPAGGGMDMIFGGGQFVAVGYPGLILTSTNGVDWVQRDSGTTGGIQSIAYGDGVYVAVGGEGTGVGSGFILTSYDGIFWLLQTLDEPLKDVTFADGQFVIVTGGFGVPPESLTSSDGTYFTSGGGDNGLNSPEINGVACGNGVCVAVGNGVFASDDGGLTWTNVNNGPLTTIYSFAQKDDTVVGVGDGGVILTTTNGVVWPDQTVHVEDNWRSVCAGGGQFVTVGTRGAIATSADGYNWTAYTATTPGTLWSIAYGAGRYVALGWEPEGNPYGYFVTSTNAVDWQERRPLYHAAINASIAYGAGRFVVFGLNGDFYTSENGLDWLPGKTGYGYSAKPVVYLNNQFWAKEHNHGALTSTDGLTWTEHDINMPSVSSICVGNGTYLATSIFAPVLWSSPDGLNWKQEKIGVSELRSSIYAYDIFCVGGTVLQSQTSLIPSMERVYQNGGEIDAEVFGRIGRDYELQSSTDLVTWGHETDYNQGQRIQPLTLPTGPDQKFYRVKLKEP